MSIGSVFILEHPTGASIWRLPEMVQLIQLPGIYLVTFHQCRFTVSGLPIRKSTRLLTNSKIVADRFDKVY